MLLYPNKTLAAADMKIMTFCDSQQQQIFPTIPLISIPSKSNLLSLSLAVLRLLLTVD